MTRELSQDRARAQPVAMLDPRYGVVRFLGRDIELSALETWLRGGDRVTVRILHAEAGQGKSRLAAELCEVAKRESGRSGRPCTLSTRSTRPG